MSIYFLPTELLQVIFRIVRDDALGVDEEDMTWISLALVCKTWGSILHGDPFLWTRLAFNERTPFSVIQNALERSNEVVDVDLKFSVGSSLPRHGSHWVWQLAVGWDSEARFPFLFPENVRLLSFRWHRKVREAVFRSVECVQADGIVSLALEEYEDPEDLDSDDGFLSDSSSAHGDLPSHTTEAEFEFEPDPEGESADDEDDFNNDSEGASSDENTDSEDTDFEGTGSEGIDADGTNSVADANWDGSESDHASSEDEISDVSIPDATTGLGNDSSTYFDSESDGAKHLSELDSEEDNESTDAHTEDDEDVDNEDDASDIDETGTDVSGSAVDEYDGVDAVEIVTLPHPASSPEVRVLELPHLPSLINLTASSVLLSIPLDVKNKLIDMSLMNTSRRAGEYEDAGIAQSWTLDALDGCDRLERLRLSHVLGIEGDDPEERTVALPNLKFLHLEDREEGVQDILRFIHTTSESLTRTQLYTLFSDEGWDSTIDCDVFVGNLPADLPGPYFADTVALDLQFSHKGTTLQGTMWAAEHDFEVSGPRQWELSATYPDTWSPDNLDNLLPSAILELSHPRIVVGTNIVELAIHIAPGFMRVFEIDWSGLIFSLPNVRKFALGSDDAVGAFLTAVSPNRDGLEGWLDLAEVHFCLATLGADIGTNVTNLCNQFRRGVDTPRPDLQMFLRLPGVYERKGVAPYWFAKPLEYSKLEQLARSLTFNGRLRIVGGRCGTCHQPWEYVDAVYA